MQNFYCTLEITVIRSYWLLHTLCHCLSTFICWAFFVCGPIVWYVPHDCLASENWCEALTVFIHDRNCFCSLGVFSTEALTLCCLQLFSSAVTEGHWSWWADWVSFRPLSVSFYLNYFLSVRLSLIFAMWCYASAAHVVMRCLCVCVRHVREFCQNE